MVIEYIQIYNEDGTATEQSAPRREIHKKGLWHRTVHVWIINNKNELLLQKRAMTKESYPGKWDISSAGHVELGSSSRAAAVREVQEELGLAIDQDELHCIFTSIQKSILNNGAFIDNEFADVYLLKKNIALKDLVIDTREVVDVAFIPMEIFREWVRDKIVELVPHDDEYEQLLAALAV